MFTYYFTLILGMLWVGFGLGVGIGLRLNCQTRILFKDQQNMQNHGDRINSGWLNNLGGKIYLRFFANRKQCKKRSLAHRYLWRPYCFQTEEPLSPVHVDKLVQLDLNKRIIAQIFEYRISEKCANKL